MNTRRATPRPRSYALAILRLALTIVVTTMLSPPLAHAAVSRKADFVPSRVIVKYKEQPSASRAASARSAVRSAMGAALKRRLDSIDAELLEVPSRDVRRLVNRWKSDPRIEYVEPDYLVKPTVIPNDPSFGGLYGMAMIQAPAAWDITRGTDVLIGVIDTGVDYNHPDLAANIWTNPGEVVGNGIDDDNNGYVDDIHGYDWVNDDADPMDDGFHGTHVAGTIAAAGNNGLGVVGLNWTARIMALKFLPGSGSGSTSDAILAVQYATQMGARLTNNSWGGGGNSQALRDAIRAAEAANSLFVAAAGNDASSEALYPARYDLENIVSVAATDQNDVIARFSNFNATSVDLGAPGVDILSTYPTAHPNGPYAIISGTSMASPHVAGVAGLIWALRPALSTEDVKQIILSSVSPNASLAGKTVTGGRLNAFAALALANGWVPLLPPEVAIDPVALSFTLDPDASTTGQLSISNVAADSRKLYWSIAPPACPWLTLSPLSGQLSGGQADQVQVGVNAFALEPGVYQCPIAVQSNDTDEPSTDVMIELSVSNGLQPPQISLAPASFSFSLITGQADGADLSISNLVAPGQRNLHWSASVQGANLAWIGISPASGVTAPGSASALHVAVSATGLTAGSYDATIVVTSGDPDDPVLQVPVHLEVRTPPVGGQKLYLFGNNSSTTIIRRNLDGTNPVTVFANLPRAVDGAVATSSGTLYWIDWGAPDESIWRGDLNGINKELFLSGVNTAVDLAIDEAAGHLYYVEQYPTKRIMRVNLDGTGLVALHTYTGQQVLDFALDLVNGKMYWAGDFPVAGVWRANLDGSNPEHLISMQVCPGVALDPAAGKLYFGEGFPNYRVRRANLDGSAIETIFSGQDGLSLDIDVAGGKLYWINRETNVVWRGNLDGTGAEVIAPFAYDIALDASPEFVVPTVCGDGRQAGDEQCDDGDTNAGDGCSATCTLETGFGCVGTEPTVCTSTCGDGHVVAGETCDDGATAPGDGCSATCTAEPGYDCPGQPAVCAPVCGDGQIIGGENCDDGDTQSNDGCSSSCGIESGYRCAGEPSECTEVCGDGLIVGTETCDDGDTQNGDGCASTCAREPGFTCTAEPSVCTPNCGDGRAVGGETCDDGDTQSDDGCSSACGVESGYRCAGEPSQCTAVCGDGVIVGNEVCDDGDTLSDDGCSSACAVESGYRCTGDPSLCTTVCGDGLVVGNEACDDGNTNDRDACRNDCTPCADSCDGTSVPLAGERARFHAKVRRNYVALSDAAVDLTGLDPTVSGATARIGRPGSEPVVTIDLPASGWVRVANTPADFRFYGRTDTRIAARLLDGRFVRFSARGVAVYPLGEPQDAIGFQFLVGDTTFCGLFGGTIRTDDGRRFLARRAPRPVNCEALGAPRSGAVSSASGR
jgi:cysteine-rich repeat protein